MNCNKMLNLFHFRDAVKCVYTNSATDASKHITEKGFVNCNTYIYKHRKYIYSITVVIISVAVLMKFWTHNLFPKFCLKFRRNFRQYFASFLSYFPALQKNELRNYIYYILQYYLFFSIFFYFFLRKFEYCGKISKRFNFWGRNFRKTFPEILTKFSVSQH